MGAALLLAFFLSGASSLVLESLWTRELGLVFGSTTLAVSTVLCTFMGGLGLGSAWAGRRADRLKDCVRAYAFCEAGVGLYALLVPLLLRGTPALARLLYRSLGDHYAALSLGRFVAAALLLGIPTTLMGATLPLLARALVKSRADLARAGSRLGTLYASNTFGALVGAFLAGFFLLPALGVRATNTAAALTDLLLAAGVLLLLGNRARSALPAAAPPGETEDDAPPPAAAPRLRRLALAAFAISGGVAMALEVLWTRALAVVIGSSVYSFTLILMAFLGGLAGGARLFSGLASRSRRPVVVLGALHLATATAITLSHRLFDKLPHVFVALLRGTRFEVDTILGSQFLLVLLVLLVPTLLMGGVFPLTMRIVAGAGTDGLDRVGRDVGRAYAWNTLGAISGAFLGGFVVLPRLGLERGIFAAAATLALLGTLLLCAGADLRRSRRAALALGLCGLWALVGRALPRWDLVDFQYGLFRVSYVRDILKYGKWPRPELLYYHDGISTTVSVERWDKNVALKNNGKVDASSGADMPTQIMVGLMPFFFTETPAPRVAVVGFGSGVTAGAVTQARTGRIDLVELEPAVVWASHFFDGVNHRPLDDPRVHLHIGDGRNFLQQSPARYDVIISEPSNPWITGVSNLFTREYWAMAKKRLAPGGVFCQWAQLYEMSPLRIKTILKTFEREFPYTYVFAAEDLSSDVILVAADHPLRLGRKELARRLGDRRLAAEAARGGVAKVEDLVAYFLLGPDELAAYTAGAPVNTDDNALIEFGAPRDLLRTHEFDPYLARVYGAGWSYGRLDPVLEGYQAGADRARLAETLLEHGRVREAERFLRRSGPEGARSRALAALLATDPELPADLEPPRLSAKLPAAELERYARQYTRVEELVRKRDWRGAQALLDSWPVEIGEEAGPDLALLYAICAWHASEFDDAQDALGPLEKDTAYLGRRPVALHLLGRVYYATAEYKKGIGYLRRALALFPSGAAPGPPLADPEPAPEAARAGRRPPI